VSKRVQDPPLLELKLPQCSIKTQCTPSTREKGEPLEHESVLESLQKRLDRNPNMMRVRRQRLNIRSDFEGMDGCDALPDENLEWVSTEMSLHVLAYTSSVSCRFLEPGTYAGDEG